MIFRLIAKNKLFVNHLMMLCYLFLVALSKPFLFYIGGWLVIFSVPIFWYRFSQVLKRRRVGFGLLHVLLNLVISYAILYCFGVLIKLA